MVGSLREVPADKKSDKPPLIVLTEVTVIPPNVFIGWAVARMEAHQPIVTVAVLEGDTLMTTYDGKASFEITILPDMRTIVQRLVDKPAT